MSVDAGTAVWLKEGALYALSTDSGIASAWADSLETEIVSPLAVAADAATEAARQQAFLEGPLAIETHNVPGLKSSLVGSPITLTGTHLGYDAGLVVFVIRAVEIEGINRTELTVLRRLT